MFEEKTREDRRQQCLRNKSQFSIPMEMPAPGKCKGYQMSTEKMYAKAEIPCCDEKEVHVDKVRYVNENMPPEDKLYDLAELFKAFGDSTRIRPSGIPRGSGSCSRSLRRRSVSATSRNR